MDKTESLELIYTIWNYYIKGLKGFQIQLHKKEENYQNSAA